MTENEAVEKLEAHIECESKRSSIEGCNEGCIDCELAYLQGTSKEHIESVKLAIQAFEKQINRCWVPCKDRLPEEINKYYLVTYRSVICGKFEQNVTISYLSTFSNGDKSWEIEEEHGNNWTVTAWQPLPEPYKE